MQAKSGAGSVDAQYVTGIGMALGAAFFWLWPPFWPRGSRERPHRYALIHVLVGTANPRSSGLGWSGDQ